MKNTLVLEKKCFKSIFSGFGMLNAFHSFCYFIAHTLQTLTAEIFGQSFPLRRKKHKKNTQMHEKSIFLKMNTLILKKVSINVDYSLKERINYNLRLIKNFIGKR